MWEALWKKSKEK